MSNDKDTPMENLIIRSLQRRTTPEEEERLRVWRESTSENEQKYLALAELWSVVGAASSVRGAEIPPEVDLIVARAEGGESTGDSAHMDAPQPVGVSAAEARRRALLRRARSSRRVFVGALAASVAVVGFGLGILSKGVIGTKGLTYNEVTTGAGESATVTFSDNTAVRLGPRSNLRLIEDGEDPVVWLDGRAYFGVVPNPSRTFTVRTPYGDAVALGTRFEVRTDDEEFRVLVVQGNVRVSSAGSSLELGEGRMSRNGEGDPPLESAVDDVDAHLAWIGQTLVFRATPLARVISEIQHRYGVAVDLEDDSLSELNVTATFTDEAVETVIFVVCEIVATGCTVEGGRYRIGVSALGVLRPTARPAAAPTRIE